MNENWWDLDFGTLYGGGAQGSTQGAGSIMQYLSNILMSQSPESGEGSYWHDYDWGGGTSIGGAGTQGGTDYTQMNLQQWYDQLQSDSAEQIEGSWLDEMSGDLLGLLNASGLFGEGNLGQQYQTNLGDVNQEIGSKIGNLQRGFGTQSKGSRYGALGTGGRNVQGGGRGQYLADIYGLQGQQAQMQQDLQEQMTSDFYSNIANYQGIYG